jgi:galactokinase
MENGKWKMENDDINAQPAPWDDQPEQPAEPAKPRRQTALGAVLSGNILSRSEVRRAYPYMIFVVAFMFFYISNAFRTQHVYREHAALTEQVKALRSKSMTVASEKMQATRQSNIMVELARRGIPLRESLTPNKVIPRDDGHTPTENR